MIPKSIKLRWSNVLRDILPETKLPISALWRCRLGLSESYALGSDKDFVEYPTNYIVCDIQVHILKDAFPKIIRVFLSWQHTQSLYK